MTKAECCHRVADFDAAIYDTEQAIADLESRLRWDDESRREWYQDKLDKERAELEDYKRRLAEFCREYGDVFHA